MEYQNYAPHQGEDLFQEAVQYAGFWERFAAMLIDGFILVIPNYILQYVAGDTAGSVISLVMYWLYFALMESSDMQATPGKKALGLRVTDVDGSPVSFGQATGRFFGRYLSMLIIFIGYLMMIWDDRKQTLHDKMASTLVVKNKPAF
jgi:uncharacterized RDD family membrane protein YckC